MKQPQEPHTVQGSIYLAIEFKEVSFTATSSIILRQGHGGHSQYINFFRSTVGEIRIYKNYSSIQYDGHDPIKAF
jgi:hypothetical protein